MKTEVRDYRHAGCKVVSGYSFTNMPSISEDDRISSPCALRHECL